MRKFDTLEDIERHREALQNARKLLTICHDTFGYPVDALMAMVLGSATLAHGIGMPLDHLLQGITAAYSDISNGGSDHGKH